MNRRNIPKKPRFETSKVILFIVGAVTIWVTAFTLHMIEETKDLSPLAI